MAPGSGMSVYGMVKCAADKPPKPIPGGIYCKCHPSASCAFGWQQKLRVRSRTGDPTSKPPEMCPPLNPGDKPTPCKCANPNPTCLCPGHYPPPPPPPPGAGNCNFTSAFDPTAADGSSGFGLGGRKVTTHIGEEEAEDEDPFAGL